MTDNAITRNAKQLAALADKIEDSQRTGCDCCDPTHDSPDPVMVRLERENERLRNQLAEVQEELGMVRLAWDSDIKIAVEARNDNTCLRGLLREAVDMPRYSTRFENWRGRVTAGLEGKP